MSRFGASIAGLERFLLNHIARSDQAVLPAAIQDKESRLLEKNEALSMNTVSAISMLQQQQASVSGLVRLWSGI